MTIQLAEHDGLTWLTLAKPPVNAVDLETIEAIENSVLGAPSENPLIIGADGKAFCAGVDTKALASYTPKQRGDMVRGITRMVAAVLNHPAPVLAAINGHALGGGLVLALTADLRIAGVTETARFGLTEAQAGVPFPQGPVEIINAALAPDLLRRLTLTSAVVDANTLHLAGVIDEICAPEALQDTVIAKARELAAQPAFEAVKLQVRGALRDRLNQLVAQKHEPMLAAFGAV